MVVFFMPQIFQNRHRWWTPNNANAWRVACFLHQIPNIVTSKALNPLQSNKLHRYHAKKRFQATNSVALFVFVTKHKGWPRTKNGNWAKFSLTWLILLMLPGRKLNFLVCSWTGYEPHEAHFAAHRYKWMVETSALRRLRESLCSSFVMAI